MKKLWNRLFLVERPSISMGLFRIAVAATVGFHVLPSFFHLQDNFFATAFKTYNSSFFTIGFLELIQKSPDWIVVLFVWIFCVSLFFFLVGFLSQISCIIMTASCYYFYALNAFAIGTLSWDILIVTLFLMCLTNYHGDYFSVDCLLKGAEDAYKRRRPFFIQRLLQLQIAFTFFYTALYKTTAQGNWITDNPIYYLMNYPPAGVVKFFLLKDVLLDKPEICYMIGISIVIIEFLMIFLLFFRRTRLAAIYLGIFFSILLVLALDVPAIFFFLYPPQLLLFINPEVIEQWIEQKRAYNESARRPHLFYDGQCQFCLNSMKQLKIMDLFNTIFYVDFQPKIEELIRLHPGLTKEKILSQLHLIEPDGKLSGGFDVFRKLVFKMPMLWPLIPIVYFPGMGILGKYGYRLIAQNRYIFHRNTTCRNHSCHKSL